MTTIVAKEGPRETVIACDSQATAQDIIEMEASKVFDRGGVLYGVAGAIPIANALRYSSIPGPGTGDADEWVNNTLCPALRDMAKELDLPRDEEGCYNFGILVEVGGRVYEITNDLTWVRNTSGTYAVGSGYAFALGALDAGATPEQAVGVAAVRDPSTGGTIRQWTVTRP